MVLKTSLKKLHNIWIAVEEKETMIKQTKKVLKILVYQKLKKQLAMHPLSCTTH